MNDFLIVCLVVIGVALGLGCYGRWANSVGVWRYERTGEGYKIEISQFMPTDQEKHQMQEAVDKMANAIEHAREG